MQNELTYASSRPHTAPLSFGVCFKTWRQRSMRWLMPDAGAKQGQATTTANSSGQTMHLVNVKTPFSPQRLEWDLRQSSARGDEEKRRTACKAELGVAASSSCAEAAKRSARGDSRGASRAPAIGPR